MMQSKWLDDHGIEPEFNESASHHKLSFFGYQRVPEDEKAKWVRRHFNTVARKYDFMNTLLSFGIHYLWKRTAVKVMALNPGDRVLDVCGGTGDLAVLASRTVGPAGQVIIYDINRAMINAGRKKLGSIPAR